MVIMGFLSKIFGPAPQKQFTLDEGMALIRSELDSLQHRNKEEAYRTAMKIYDEIRLLAGLISDFEEKEIYERAKGSAAVKDRFCTLAKSQLTSVRKPDEDSSLFLQEIRSLLSGIGGLTQRQMLHINFFFREDFRPIAKKMKEINSLLDVASGGGDHQKTVNLHSQIQELERKKSHLKDMLAVEEGNLERAEGKGNTLPQLQKQPGSNDLDDAESRLKSLKQEIDSFLAVQKTLKKYAYIVESKDPILETYIDSPSSALLLDEEFRIIDFATNASQLVREGKIEGDRKLENILSSVDYVKRKRDAMISAKRAVEDQREKFRLLQDQFESSLKARTNHLAEMEYEIKEVEKSIRDLKEEIAVAEAEHAKAKTELYMIAAKLLNATII